MNTRRAVHVRSDRWAEVGLWARTREMTGTVRTLAGSVRCDRSHYTGIDDSEHVNRNLSRRRILERQTAFLSTEPISASSPHRSPALEAYDRFPAEDISTR
jgi:hypothetical protein